MSPPPIPTSHTQSCHMSSLFIYKWVTIENGQCWRRPSAGVGPGGAAREMLWPGRRCKCLGCSRHQCVADCSRVPGLWRLSGPSHHKDVCPSAALHDTTLPNSRAAAVSLTVCSAVLWSEKLAAGCRAWTPPTSCNTALPCPLSRDTRQ